MALYEVVYRDPSLPHQMHFLLSTSGNIIMTCNCQAVRKYGRRTGPIGYKTIAHVDGMSVPDIVALYKKAHEEQQ